MYAIDRLCVKALCRDMFSCVLPLPQLAQEHHFSLYAGLNLFFAYRGCFEQKAAEVLLPGLCYQKYTRQGKFFLKSVAA